eukprot:scpid52589/ scgid13882/ 
MPWLSLYMYQHCRLLQSRTALVSLRLCSSVINKKTDLPPASQRDSSQPQHSPRRIPGRYPSMRSPMTVDADFKNQLSPTHRSADLDPYRPEILSPELIKKAARLDADYTAKYVFQALVGLYVVFVIIGLPCFTWLLYFELSQIRPAVEEPTHPMKYLYRPELVEVSEDLMWKVNENL